MWYTSVVETITSEVLLLLAACMLHKYDELSKYFCGTAAVSLTGVAFILHLLACVLLQYFIRTKYTALYTAVLSYFLFSF